MKISFFENIYYWLWYYLNKVIPKSGMEPYIAASTFLTAFRIINLFFLIGVFSAILKVNILNELMSTDDKLETKFIFIIAGLLILFIDERLYQRRIDIIVDKFDNVESEKRKKKKRIFLYYLLVTAITICLSPWVLSFYAA